MKIVILSDRILPYHAGGAEVSTFRIATALKNISNEVYIITTHNHTKQPILEYDNNNIKIISLYTHYPQRLRNIIGIYNPVILKRLKPIVKEISPHILQVHNVHRYISFYSIKLLAYDYPVVFTAHDYLLICPTKFICFDKTNNYKINPTLCIKCQRLRFIPFRNTIIKNFTKHASIITLSQFQKNILSINGINNLVTTIYNGIAVESFCPDDEDTYKLKMKLGIKDSQKVVLFVGRLSYYKGWLHLMKALKIVKNKIKNVVLVIASKYSKDADTVARDLGIDIRWTDWVSIEMMPNVYNLADVVSVPSIYPDPAPAVVLEAMCIKKPTIASIYGGAGEIVKDKQTGFIINPYDIENFADTIMTLLKDETLCKTLGNAAFDRLVKKFHININATKRIALYEQLLCKKKQEIMKR